mgnify:CR=1 FL=1
MSSGTFCAGRVKNPPADLGVEDLARIEIPRAERPRDPVFQRWVRFRCEETRRSLEKIRDALGRAGRKVLLAANVGLGSSQRPVLDNGNWVSNLSLLDFTYAENHLFPGWRESKIIGQHFPMSVCEAIGVRVIPGAGFGTASGCLLYTSPSPRDS